MLCPAGIVSPMRTKMVIDLITRVQLRPTEAKTEWLLNKIVMETTRPRLGAEPWRPHCTAVPITGTPISVRTFANRAP